MASAEAIEVPPRLMTAEEHLRDHGDGRTELVRGRLERRPVPGERHSKTAGLVYHRLVNWDVDETFEVMVEAGNVLERGPDTVGVPDVSAIRVSRLRGGNVAVGYDEIAVDLAVEVRSPDQSLRHLRGKAAEYAAAGTPLVWIVDPETRTVEVHEGGVQTKTLTETDTITGADALPGFECEVRLLFDRT